MALIGTHIRFALDLKNDLNIQSLDQYISGTIYPDSRYLSKIDRTATHSPKFLSPQFYKNNDFKKGWFAHLLYDDIQFKVFAQIFPDLLDKFKEETGYLSTEHWILRSGLKTFQDLDDVSQFPIKDYLSCLKYVETPNHEASSIISNYNQMFINIYGKNNLETKDLVEMWARLGVDQDLVNQIGEKITELKLNKEILQKIPLIYPETLKYYKKLFL